MAVVRAANKLSDGKAIKVDLFASVVKGDVILADGWLGVAQSDGDSGDTIGLAIAPEEYVFDVGATSVNKGDIVYITTASLTGHLPTLSGWSTTAGGGKVPLFKATGTKTSDNYIKGILLTNGWLS